MISAKETIFLPNSIERNLIGFDIPVTRPILTSLKIDDGYFPLFLEPGFCLKLADAPDSLHNNLQFSGEGSKLNNVMSGLNNLHKKYYLLEYGLLNADEFLEKLQIIQSKADSIYPNGDDLQIGRQLFETKLIARKINYILINYDLYSEETKIPGELKEAFRQVLEYPELIEVGSIDHSFSLNMYLKAVIEPQLWNPAYSGNDSLKRTFPQKADNYIKSLSFDVQTKELLRAKNMYTFLLNFGADSVTSRIYDQFNADYENSKYLIPLKNTYEELTTLGNGTIAPGIEMQTVEGRTVSLNNLIGKIIYLDIWATWCKPCIKNFPFSSRLDDKFSDNDVQFVYLSIDEDRDKWLKFLAEKKAPDGLHYVEKEVGSAFSAFKINGIPRYILIGRDGRIINAYAPGPSSDEIESLIADNL